MSTKEEDVEGCVAAIIAIIVMLVWTPVHLLLFSATLSHLYSHFVYPLGGLPVLTKCQWAGLLLFWYALKFKTTKSENKKPDGMRVLGNQCGDIFTTCFAVGLLWILSTAVLWLQV